MALDAPVMGVPPVMEILVLLFDEGLGVEDLDVGFDLVLDFEILSDIRYPAAVVCLG